MFLTALKPYENLNIALIPTSLSMSLLCHIITSFCFIVTEEMTIIISDKYTDCHEAVNLLGDKVFLLQRTVNTSCVSNYMRLLREGGIFLLLEDHSFRRNNKKENYDHDSASEPIKHEYIQRKD